MFIFPHPIFPANNITIWVATIRRIQSGKNLRPVLHVHVPIIIIGIKVYGVPTMSAPIGKVLGESAKFLKMYTK